MKTLKYHNLKPTSVLLIGLMALSAPLQANSLTGLGYIDLQADPAAPYAGSHSSYGNRFTWEPVARALYIGAFSPGQLIFQDSISIHGIGGGNNTVSLGGTAGNTSVALGMWSHAGNSTVSIGAWSGASGFGSIAIGPGSLGSDDVWTTSAHGNASVVIGYTATDSYETIGDGAVVIGGYAQGAAGSTVLGGGARTFSPYTVVVGAGSTANAQYSSALGPYVTTHAIGSVGLGSYNDSSLRKNGTTVDPIISNPLDPLLTLGQGTNQQGKNAFTIYRDGSARFEGPVQIKSGTGYLTLQPGGTINRTLTLPDADGALLASTSTLDATKLSGEVPVAALPVEVTQLGATVELDSANETTGNLPWSRISDKPTTLDGYLAVNAEGRITTPIRIEPQGDVPMF
jgi:hypothetical protein